MFPEIDWLLISPIISVFSAGVIGVLVETFVAPRLRYYVQLTINNVLLAFALCVSFYNLYTLPAGGKFLVENELVFDLVAAIGQVIVLIIAMISFQALSYRNQNKESYVFVSNAAGKNTYAYAKTTFENKVEEKIVFNNAYFENQRTEYLALVMFSLGGMLVFVMSHSFLTLFIALELMSLPLYVLTALNKYDRAYSKEGAIKYFLMGSFASAIMLMGFALIYGATGSYFFQTISNILPNMQTFVWGYILGIILVFVGLLFKVGAVPFHAWTPDAYQGAPTAVTGFMAANIKIVAFIVLTRFVFSLNSGLNSYISWIYWTIIVLTILVGTFVGLVQDNIKRLLAYSSIAHTGFLLISVFSVNSFGNLAMMFYLFTYGVATIGVFVVVSMIKRRDELTGELVEDNSINAYIGLGRKNPFLAISMLFFLLSFAGIPLTAGFVGKFMVFVSGIGANLIPLVVLAIFASVVTAFYYLRIIWMMYTTNENILELNNKNGEIFIEKGMNLNIIVVGICLTIITICGLFPSIFFYLLPVM